jgi:hypothetical protein
VVSTIKHLLNRGGKGVDTFKTLCKSDQATPTSVWHDFKYLRYSLVYMNLFETFWFTASTLLFVKDHGPFADHCLIFQKILTSFILKWRIKYTKDLISTLSVLHTRYITYKHWSFWSGLIWKMRMIRNLNNDVFTSHKKTLQQLYMSRLCNTTQNQDSLT